MKKFLAIIAMTATLMLTACGPSNTVTYKPSNPFWLNKDEYEYGAGVAEGFYEENVYGIVHTLPKTSDGKDASNKVVSVEYSPESYYSTVLEAASYNDKKCYLLSSKLNIGGSYTIQGEEQKYPFTDTTETKTYFEWDGGFTPIYSEQNAQSTLPVNAAAVKDDHGNRIIQIHYKTTVNYVGADANVKFEIMGDEEAVKKMQPYFSLADGFETKFKKYDKSNFIDSNMLYFAVRAFEFDEGLSYSFSTIDVLSNAKHSMSYSVNTTAAVTDKFVDVLLNGVKAFGSAVSDGSGNTSYVYEPSVITVNIKMTGTAYAGTGIACKYIKDNGGMHRMCSMVTPLPYSLGTLEYRLKEINTVKPAAQ